MTEHRLRLKPVGRMYEPMCSCGWKSPMVVPFALKELGVEQLRKHANAIHHWPTTIKSINLSLRIDAGEQSPEDVRELIEIAKKEASRR